MIEFVSRSPYARRARLLARRAQVDPSNPREVFQKYVTNVLDQLAIEKDEEKKGTAAAAEVTVHHDNKGGSPSAVSDQQQRQMSRRQSAADNGGNVPGVGTCALYFAQPWAMRDYESGEKCGVTAGIRQTIAQGFHRAKGYLAQRLFAAPRPRPRHQQQQQQQQ